MWYNTEEFNPQILKDLSLDYVDMLIIRKLIKEYTSTDAKYLYVNNELYVCSAYSKILKNFNIEDFQYEELRKRLQHYIDIELIKLCENLNYYTPELPDTTENSKNFHQNILFTFTCKINGLVHERN